MKEQTILLIEDNPNDIDLIKEGFRLLNTNIKVEVVSTAEDAMNFLLNRNLFVNAKRPHLIIINIEAFSLTAKELFKKIRELVSCSAIPIVVFTNSVKENQEELYKLHANIVLAKPRNLVYYMSTLSQIKKLWLNYPAENIQ